MSCYLSEANMICLLAGSNSVTGPQWGLTPHCRVDTKTPRTLLNTNLTTILTHLGLRPVISPVQASVILH